jgi:NAD-dependent SIR2 family protein deacetylase
MNKGTIEQAAEAISNARALLIGAGAGMGVDSGLPDFRGPSGFWQAYPQLYGRSFAEVANPFWFHSDPTFAWGFYGHRLNLYRQTQPHAGFSILLRWARTRPQGYFVFTSNVDGHFQKSGFPEERVVECHGSINHLQCAQECHPGIWSADEENVTIDETELRAVSELPRCPQCQGMARPNVLMFGDGQWIFSRTEEQIHRYRQWLTSVDQAELLVIELGAGTAIPTVRGHCEKGAGKLIRINIRESEVSEGGIALALGAHEALSAIDQRLKGN